MRSSIDKLSQKVFKGFHLPFYGCDSSLETEKPQPNGLHYAVC